MYLTGLTDEAAESIDEQIRATQALGWRRIEARHVDGRNLHDLSDAAFERVCEKLNAADIQVDCLASAVGNWAKRIDEPFESSLAEAERAIPRMKRLGTRVVRVMSFAVLEGRAPEDQMQEERFARLREICRMFAAHDLLVLHENCANYGGMGHPFTLKLLENVPGLKLVFDTGNPLFLDDRAQPAPLPKQDSWEFYAAVKNHIARVHIKDGVWDRASQQMRFTFPGEGGGQVRRIVSDLLQSGYDGALSIEPNLRLNQGGDDPSARLENYVEFGRRVMRLLDDLGWRASEAVEPERLLEDGDRDR